MVNNQLKAIFAIVLLALHIIAAALSAQLWDNIFDDGTLKEDNAVGIIGGPVFTTASYTLVGFISGAGLALVLLLKGTQDEAILFGGAIAATLGIIELGFGAKTAKLEQNGLGKNIKALEAFSILAGGASFLFGILFILAGDQPSST